MKRALVFVLAGLAACSQQKGGGAAVADDAQRIVPLVRASFPRLSQQMEPLRDARNAQLSRIRARLPAHARDVLHLESPDRPDAWLDVRAVDLEDVPARHDGTALVFAHASRDLHVVHSAARGGIEELRVLESALASNRVRYHLEHASGYTLRVREGRIELVDDKGWVTIASDPIVAFDAKGARREAVVVQDGLDVTADVDTSGLTFPVAIDPLWTTAPSSTYPHDGGSRVFLADGRLLVTTGSDGAGGLTKATEIYDPTTNTWSNKAPIPTARDRVAMAARIASGTHVNKILVAGGSDASTANVYANEMYDPATNSWSSRAAVPTTAWASQMVATGSKMLTLKYGVYDADTNAWTAATWATGALANARYTGAGLVTLPDNRVLIIAGQMSGPTTFAKVDMYAPATNTLTNLADTPVASMYAGVTLLSSTKVLVTGGTIVGIKSSAPTNAAAIYDVSANTWTTVGPMISARSQHSATRMPSGKVAIIGGIANVEIFDPLTGAFTSAGNAPTVFHQPSFLLPSGSVVLGGLWGSDPVGVYAPYALGTACTLATECASGSCVDGVCCSTASCASGAKCNTPTKKGTCAKPLAVACAANSECESGNCVDGVCCNSACGSQCQACDVAGKAGTCSPVTGAVHGTRTACAGSTSTDPCAKQICNGTDVTACHYPTAGTVACGANTCTAGTETHTSSCNGSGACSDVPKSCGVYTCGATSCKFSCTANADCVAGYYCKSNACVPLEGLGSTCSTAVPCAAGLFCTDGVCCGVASCGTGATCAAAGHKGTCMKNVGSSCASEGECASGACVDGVCCDSGCSGQCEACDVPGSVGTCVAVTGKPRGARPACASDPSDLCANAVCDGTDRATCAAFPGSDVECRPQSCADATLTARTLCDGKGTCAAATKTSCGGFACDEAGAACRTTCNAPSDCASGFQCVGGNCEKPSAKCSDDGLTLIDASGNPITCAPYRCRDGKCQSTCAASDECVSPNLCADGLCVPPPTATPESTSDDAGGCAFGGAANTRALAALVIASVVVSLRRRRR